MPNLVSIDINCDMGESYGDVIIGNDAVLFPYITSSNIACGFHGGDPVHMEKTILLALKHGVQIGAHPSYPDRENFGRKKMRLPPEELKAIIRYQLAALIGVAKALGGNVRYVKPHGALYNTASEDAREARVLIESILSIQEDLGLMGLAGSTMEDIAQQMGIRFIAEAFADRRYHSNGHLVSRDVAGAVIDDPEVAAKQVLSLVLKKQVTSVEGEIIPIIAQSICVHGDHLNSLAILGAIDTVCKKFNIRKDAFIS